MHDTYQHPNIQVSEPTDQALGRKSFSMRLYHAFSLGDWKLGILMLA